MLAKERPLRSFACAKTQRTPRSDLAERPRNLRERYALKLLIDGLAAAGRSKRAEDVAVGGVAEEANGTVAHAGVDAAGVMATAGLTNFVVATRGGFDDAGATGGYDLGRSVAVTV